MAPGGPQIQGVGPHPAIDRIRSTRLSSPSFPGSKLMIQGPSMTEVGKSTAAANPAALPCPQAFTMARVFARPHPTTSTVRSTWL